MMFALMTHKMVAVVFGWN